MDRWLDGQIVGRIGGQMDRQSGEYIVRWILDIYSDGQITRSNVYVYSQIDRQFDGYWTYIQMDRQFDGNWTYIQLDRLLGQENIQLDGYIVRWILDIYSDGQIVRYLDRKIVIFIQLYIQTYIQNMNIYRT